MIDTAVKYKNTEGKEYYVVQPMSRMMYLSAWDVYVPATYRGAPPVCHFCRQSGHIRAACPVLLKRQCFKCRKLGHNARFCNEEETTFEEAPDEYESSKKAIEEPNTVNAQRRTRENNREKRHRFTSTIHDVAEQQMQRQAAAAAQPANKQKGSTGRPRRSSTAEAMDVDPKALQCAPQGSYASKHAPLDVSLHTRVDSQGSSAANTGFSSDVLPLFRRHSVSSTSMSETPVHRAADWA